jgi:hypothetical protein
MMVFSAKLAEGGVLAHSSTLHIYLLYSSKVAPFTIFPARQIPSHLIYVFGY